MDDRTAKKIMTEVTKTYDDISREFSDSRAFAGKEFDMFKEYLKPGQTVLDLGCGNGRLLHFLEKEASAWHQKTFHYFGVDSSKNLLIEARKKHPRHTFKSGDMTKIPAEDGSVDVLFCIRAFHHLPDRKTRLKALKEMKRALKPDGILIVTVWNLWQKKYAWELFRAFLRCIVSLGHYAFNDTFIPWGKNKKKRYYHAFTLKELRELVKSAGWTVEELSKTDPSTKSHDYVLIARKS